MAQGIWLKFGGGGVTSDDVTAEKKHVVAGYHTVTRESDDEVVEGTLANRGNGGADNRATEFWYLDSVKGYVARFEEGAYYQHSQFKPWVNIPLDFVKSATTFNANYVLETATICNERGRIKVVDTARDNYNYNKATNVGINAAGRVFWVDIPHGNAYYTRHDNIPHVVFDASRLGNAPNSAILQGYSATSEHGLAVQGTIPRWVNHAGDVHTCWNNEAHVWDDTYAGRGRGVILRVPDRHYIEGANWVYKSAPGLHPHNIREGVNLFGMNGTMKDYGAGRVAFNGATFDGTLISGVAENKIIEVVSGGRVDYTVSLNHVAPPGHTIAYISPLTFRIYLFSNVEWGIGIFGNHSVHGVVARESIDMTPFRTIRVHVRHDGSMRQNGSTYAEVSITMQFGVIAVRSLPSTRGNIRSNRNASEPFIHKTAYSVFRTDHPTNPVGIQEKVMDLDVSDMNEQCFIYFGYYAVKSTIGIIDSTVRFTRIEFIN